MKRKFKRQSFYTKYCYLSDNNQTTIILLTGNLLPLNFKSVHEKEGGKNEQK